MSVDFIKEQKKRKIFKKLKETLLQNTESNLLLL